MNTVPYRQEPVKKTPTTTINTVPYRTDRTILPKKANKADKYHLKTPILDQNRLFYTKNRGYFLGRPGVGQQGKTIELLKARRELYKLQQSVSKQQRQEYS